MTDLSSAALSADGMYRYDLVRQWGDDRLLLWCMLNPSTADATEDDATIRRLRSFTKRDGYGGFVVVNLFAYRTHNPRRLLEAVDPQGPENAATVAKWLSDPRVEAVVAAWGAWRVRMDSSPEGMLVENAPVLCLGKTASGAPRHPLYLKGTTRFTAWP